MHLPFTSRSSSRDEPHEDHQQRRLNILLTNGRFPVSLDLARQLHGEGHTVFCVDPMEYHVCKFSNAVKKSHYVPAPHVDAAGYVQGVAHAVAESRIDLIIPLHEEIFYLAKSGEPEILRRMFAPDFATLLRLHNKWEFVKWLDRAGIERPRTWLCKSRADMLALDLSQELALKPVFGRAKSGVFHHVPNAPLPSEDELVVDDENHYVAQEWLRGSAYCTYSVVRSNKLQAFAVYPVTETLDGSSCVYFEAIEHPRIRTYCERVAAALPPTAGGQIALDLIETPDGRLLAIECNPRATSGIHLYSRTPHLARALVDPHHEPPSIAKAGRRRQVAPGMMMWEKKDATFGRYVQHQKRLMSSRDVVFTVRDFVPVLVQPFLLTSYYKICQERGMRIPEMFQWDLTWEPQGEELASVRRLLEEAEDVSEESPVPTAT
ncbi:hypothetical protein BOTBODRAFT_37752 [Botryobasidium botryosum FD-172 SS1]|uniref:ATP-grasp domain-containing protein n=1 Tax=Botryobasidium botryosum (strain FD-172 SS1) TaxID=930990 RepID=A0A067LZA1_BOTB1|nr:hypothetical protein BOTBODRAFT_37752 [Botryobasidium botryosum FD-172 SS1]